MTFYSALSLASRLRGSTPMPVLYVVLWVAMGSVLGACPGSLHIDLDLDQAAGDDDDSADPTGLDFATYRGVESLHVDWALTERPEGLSDCAGEWQAEGENTTADDSDLCLACDQIWEVTLTAGPEAQACLAGTALSVEDQYVRKVGIAFDEASDIHFRLWRNLENLNDPLEPVGIGALDPGGADFTWSGNDQYEFEGLLVGAYTYYFSGEGCFAPEGEECPDDAR